MQQTPSKNFEGTQRLSFQEACLEELNRCCWKNEFICPKCGQDKSYKLKHGHLHACTKCSYQVSLTDGTVFEHTCLPLPKWFMANYLKGADKGRIWVDWLIKMTGVAWPNAGRMLKNLRQSMEDRYRGQLFDGDVEVDNSLVGVGKLGARGRETKCKSRCWSCVALSFPHL